LEGGAEDVEFDENRAFIFCDAGNLHQVSSSFDENIFENLSAKLIWKPKEPIAIELDQLEKIVKLIDALEDLEDVRSVTANFQASDEDLEKISG